MTQIKLEDCHATPYGFARNDSKSFRQPKKFVLSKSAVCWWVEDPPYDFAMTLIFRQPENILINAIGK